MEKDDYNEVKQVIVMRTDLNMRKGKMAAQAAHASMKLIMDRMKYFEYAKESTVWDGFYIWQLEAWESEPLHRWLHGVFTKVVVGVGSEEELFEIQRKAEAAGILTALVTDAGRTEFHGERTNTCLAVGPEWSDKLDKITGHLKLL